MDALRMKAEESVFNFNTGKTPVLAVDAASEAPDRTMLTIDASAQSLGGMVSLYMLRDKDRENRLGQLKEKAIFAGKWQCRFSTRLRERAISAEE